MIKFILSTGSILAITLGLLICYGQVFGAESITISPGSVTFHGTADTIAREEFKNNIGTTTFHPGINLLYKNTDDNIQAGGFYFSDSFGNHAGGLAAGPLWDVLGPWVQVGLVGGLYVRERVPGSVNGFPISIKTSDVEIAPLVAGSLSVEVPLNEGIGLETNCYINWLVNNCGLGLKIGF